MNKRKTITSILIITFISIAVMSIIDGIINLLPIQLLQ